MAKKFHKSISKERTETIIEQLAGKAKPPTFSKDLVLTTAMKPPAAKGEPIGCCAIVVNSSTHLRPTTQAVCGQIEQELNGAGSTQWFADPCRAW
ncbi:hypothetical protein [Mesorhizobium sp. M0047]|uniref:hypothetical protein n=1 Tax=Mesorhizobium sp. M0047 TaxID=2956859 RepID=UPI003334D3BF